MNNELYHRNRREFARGAFSLTSIALAGLLQNQSSGEESTASDTSSNPLAAKPPHFAPRAKHVIYLHMIGAPSQLDMFDAKPQLEKWDGKACPAEVTKDRDFAFIGKTSTLAASQWKFGQHGESGQTISELLPHMAGVADELAIIRSMHTDEINHAPAQMFLHSGFGRSGRPSFGSWVTYGLGSENEELPAYVVLLTGPAGGAGTSLWSPGFLPSVYQGVQFRSEGDPVLFLSNPEGHLASDRRRVLNTLRSLNEEHFDQTGDREIPTRIAQYEMAYRMQASVPDLMDIEEETVETLDLYGAEPGKASFANNCLLARRFVQRGVRLIELYDGDWDHHSNLANRLPKKCQDIDQPIAALIQDLRRHGLLDDTLVIWGSEFGRTPLSQGNAEGKHAGRDHHKDAFTMWLAGGGIKGGVSHGLTDDFGMDIAENPVHVHDLNATVLHLLGLDHEQLTYRYQGREFRLTDVEGELIRPILA